MKTIWKYIVEAPRNHGDRAVVTGVPLGSEIVKFDMQGDYPVLWMLGDSAAEKRTLHFYWAWTGHDIDTNDKDYVGTIRVGQDVCHLFVMVGVIDLGKFADAGGYR